MSAWIGDDGRIIEPGPFDQDREPPEVPLAEWERDSHDHPDEYAPEEPGPFRDMAFAASRGEVKEVADSVDAIEHKLDKLIALLSPPRLPIDTPDIAVIDPAGPGATIPPSPLAFPPGTEITGTEMTPAQDRAHAQEVAQSARVEAAKAEMEARQAHAANAIDPAEAAAQGIGYTTDLGRPLEIGERPGFRDQPAMPDDNYPF